MLQGPPLKTSGQAHVQLTACHLCVQRQGGAMPAPTAQLGPRGGVERGGQEVAVSREAELGAGGQRP